MSAAGVRLVVETRGVRAPVSLDHYVDGDLREAVAIEANRWIKGLRLAAVDGVPLRDRFHYRGDSLWWFTELYLHKEARVARWLQTLRALERCFDALAPDKVEIVEGGGEDRVLVSAVARARNISSRGGVPSTSSLERLGLEARAHFFTWSAHLSRVRHRAPTSPPPRGAIAAFVHSAFWRRPGDDRDGEEGYIGPVLDRLQAERGRDGLVLVGVGPRVNFRARRWWHGVTVPEHDARLPFAPVEAFSPVSALRGSLDVWRRRRRDEAALLGSHEVRDAARLASYDLWPLVANQLRGVVALQWPWSARAMDEAGAALDAIEPAAVLTYAEAGGWGRAIVLESRRRGVPSVGLQHGFIYRHWLNYLHEPDEMAASTRMPTDQGFPAPTRTLLFDGYAERHLLAAGHFASDRIAVTGSPRLDALAARWDRLGEADLEAVRRSLGIDPGDRVVLVTTKHTQIRRVFRTLAQAAAALPGVRLVVKCHPAETGEPYLRDAAGVPRVVIAPASADLAALLALARVVVTVNSTVAVDALVLGIPALVVDLPNNLSPFVEARVLGSALTGTGIAAALEALVEDTPARAALLARRDAFVREHRMGSDGRAAERATRAIIELSRGVSAPRVGLQCPDIAPDCSGG